MIKENIRHFKLTTNEEIICEVVQWDTNETSGILIRKVMKLCDTYNISSGYKFFSFRPWLSFADDPNILQTVNSDHIIGETTPSDDLIKLYEKSIIKMNKFLKEKSKDLGPIDLEKYDHLTDEELHEVLETKRLKEQQDDEDSDEPTNILQFPKIFH